MPPEPVDEVLDEVLELDEDELLEELLLELDEDELLLDELLDELELLHAITGVHREATVGFQPACEVLACRHLYSLPL